MVEQVTLNHWVHGSSPCTPTIFQEAGSSRPFLFPNPTSPQRHGRFNSVPSRLEREMRPFIFRVSFPIPISRISTFLESTDAAVGRLGWVVGTPGVRFRPSCLSRSPFFGAALATPSRTLKGFGSDHYRVSTPTTIVVDLGPL